MFESSVCSLTTHDLFIEMYMLLYKTTAFQAQPKGYFDCTKHLIKDTFLRVERISYHAFVADKSDI